MAKHTFIKKLERFADSPLGLITIGVVGFLAFVIDPTDVIDPSPFGELITAGALAYLRLRK